nr:MAG TPA: ATP synthase B/B' [Caudoviricetes sp.]
MISLNTLFWYSVSFLIGVAAPIFFVLPQSHLLS